MVLSTFVIKFSASPIKLFLFDDVKTHEIIYP